MKHSIIIIFSILSIIQANAQKIKFKDLNLKKALIELGYDRNKNSEIEIKEIDTIQKLNISKRNIKLLDDLVYFKNLKDLNAMTNEIKEINALNGNQSIHELNLGENKVGPKLTIKDMPNLTGVYAFRNGISEFEFVGEYLKLKSLYIQGNPVEYLNLQNLKNLESLQLFECDNLKTINFHIETKLKQFFLLDIKVVNVSKTENIRTVYLEKKSDPKNSPKVDSVKIAPTIRIKEGMIIKPN
jgi:hypothetical protein